MIVGRPISEICRELAKSALLNRHDLLATLLGMAALEAAENGARHDDVSSNIQERLVGAWDWDIASGRIYADARFAQLFGIGADDASRGVPLQVWLDAIHPDDVGDVSRDIKRSMETGALFAREYRIVSDDNVHWVYARGKCTLDEAGTAVRFPGAILDITEEKTDDHTLSIAPM